jgi:D-alanyl-D-alanine carboxypeptidase
MPAQNNDDSINNTIDNNKEDFIEDFWSGSFAKAGLPDSLKEKIIANLTQGPDFVMELLTVLEGDSYLYLLVDKQHGLNQNYVPTDLVELVSGSYRINRQGLMLRKAAAEALETMAAAARLDGVTMIAASAYRSYQNQEEIYNRNVRQMGQQAADRESARPGHSQHQLGLVLDFHPIDDSFAATSASAWLKTNASSFGWSLSYPDGYEELTGYRWESWHYRYVGQDLAAFIDRYFDGIQQYALQFILAWLEASD